MSVESGGGDIGPQDDGVDQPDGGGPPAGPAHEAVEPTPEELTLELARAEAERDAAVAALDQRGRRERRRARARRIVVGVLVVLFAILLPVTYVVTWAHRVVLTTSGFEKTVVPIGTDPAVTSAAAVAITNQIFTSLNPQQTVANALPPKAAFLAGPVTNAAKGYVQDAVTKTLQSSQFQVLWKQAVDFAHAQLLSVLNGNSKAVTTTNGQVVLNLVPLLNDGLTEPARLHLRRGRPAGHSCRPSAATNCRPPFAKQISHRPQPARAHHLRADSPVPCRQAHPGPPRRAPLQRDRGVAAHSDAGGGRPGPVAVPAPAAHPAATVLSAVCSVWWSSAGWSTGSPIRSSTPAYRLTSPPGGPSSATCFTSTSASAAGWSSASSLCFWSP